MRCSSGLLPVAVGVTMVIGLAVPPPAVADSTDDAFLASLHQAGLTFRSPNEAIAAGHAVCQLVADGKQGPDVLSVLESANPGVTPEAAQKFMGISMNVYCPDKLSPRGNPGGTPPNS